VYAAPWLLGRKITWPKPPGFLARLSAVEKVEVNVYVNRVVPRPLFYA
jgi:hypothetical protein